MKVIDLQIHNIRGIRDLSLMLDGKNMVIWGPNGSGKSTVVDAIDFLLTGQIQRLTGTGTAGITLKKHGAHIDTELDHARVSALVKLPELENPFRIERKLDNPTELICDDIARPYLYPVLDLASRGQHILTRRELLKYVTAEAGKRATEIQALLGITEIENIRRSFVKVRTATKTEVTTKADNLEKAKGTINATIQARNFDVETVIKRVNNHRSLLGGDPVTNLSSKSLKKGIKPITIVSKSRTLSITVLSVDITNLKNIFSEASQNDIAKHDANLRRAVEFVHDNPNLREALKLQELTRKGLELLSEHENCPLCDTTWPPGELKEYLENRLSKAKIGDEYHQRIKIYSKYLGNSLNPIISSLEKVISATELVKLREEAKILINWLNRLKNLQSTLPDPVNKYLSCGYDEIQVKAMLANKDVEEAIDRVDSKIRKQSPEVTPEQRSLEMLTRLQVEVKAFEQANKLLEVSRKNLRRAERLIQGFEEARDEVLGNLYGGIKERFEEFYRQVHSTDESGFIAELEPKGAGLKLEVDFYGRGVHPPHALHSEGHQDSMGICLYLALAEKLTKDIVDIIFLDDVVMAVDVDHRRSLSDLLKSAFPNKQFLITTHDKTWANQLKYNGFVTSKGFVEFYNWSLDTGPHVNQEADIWNKIESNLINNDIPAAAARLRRGSEDFFGRVCDALQAPVPFQLNGKYELGMFLSSAMSTYKTLLKKAKNSANSWEDQSTVQKLSEVDKNRKLIYRRVAGEQWAINLNVHYNEWANFSQTDFRPVVEAFQDLFGLFICSNCGGILQLLVQKESKLVRCGCGKVNWNLSKQA